VQLAAEYLHERATLRLSVVRDAHLPDFAANTDPGAAANARASILWLVEDWPDDYPHPNVAVFDFYSVLSSNGRDPHTNDPGSASGNHHRYRDGQIEYVTDQGKNTSAYAVDGDSHPPPMRATSRPPGSSCRC